MAPYAGTRLVHKRIDRAMHREMLKRTREQRVLETRLITEARTLKSEHGENPEYDRALCELIAGVTGLDRATVAKRIGVREVGPRAAYLFTLDGRTNPLCPDCARDARTDTDLRVRGIYVRRATKRTLQALFIKTNVVSDTNPAYCANCCDPVVAR